MLIRCDRCGLWCGGRMMAYILRRDHEDHVLRNVGGVIADAFEMPRDENQVERRLDRFHVLEHVGEQLAEDVIFMVSARDVRHHAGDSLK